MKLIDSDIADRTPRYSATPDDEVYKHLARTYAKHNHAITGAVAKTCPSHAQGLFDEGITNGAAWYVIHGWLITIQIGNVILQIGKVKPYFINVHFTTTYSNVDISTGWKAK